MASHLYELLGIGPDVELGKDGSRIKENAGVVEFRDNADSAFVKVRGDHPVDENDFVTKRYLETRANVIVTGQIDGGAPPAAGTAGRVFICTTAGGVYNLNSLYYDNGTSWEEIAPIEGMSIKITDDLTGGTVEFIGDHIYVWDADGGTWVDIGPAPAEAAVIKHASITLTEADTGANLIKQIPANAFLTRVKVNVTEVFDGTTPTLEIGDGTDPDRHMTALGNKLNKLGLYETSNLYLYGGATNVNATLTIGGTPTQGQCTVYIEYAIQ